MFIYPGIPMPIAYIRPREPFSIRKMGVIGIVTGDDLQSSVNQPTVLTPITT